MTRDKLANKVLKELYPNDNNSEVELTHGQNGSVVLGKRGRAKRHSQEMQPNCFLPRHHITELEAQEYKVKDWTTRYGTGTVFEYVVMAAFERDNLEFFRDGLIAQKYIERNQAALVGRYLDNFLRAESCALFYKDGQFQMFCRNNNGQWALPRDHRQLTDNLSSATYRLLEDLNIFELATKCMAAKKEYDNAKNAAKVTGDTEWEAPLDGGAWLGKFVEKVWRLLDQWSVAIETGNWDKFKDGCLNPLKERWKWTYDGRDFTAGKYMSNYHSYGTPAPRDVEGVVHFDTYKHVFLRPNEYTFHTPDLAEKLLGIFDKPQQELFLLALGRAALGGYTDITGKKVSLKDWRYAVLLDGAPRIGKSYLMHIITQGMLEQGLTYGLLPHRLTAGFGFGVFGNNLVLADDLTDEHFIQMSENGIVKSALSGAIISDEKKGKDAVDIEANGVLFAAINGLSVDKLGSLDDGLKSRILKLNTKQRADKFRGPNTSEDFFTLTKTLCPGLSEKEVGAYLVSVAVEKVRSILLEGKTISSVVEQVRKDVVNDLQQETAQTYIAEGTVQFAALAIRHLHTIGKLSDEQVELELSRIERGMFAMDIPQLALIPALSCLFYTKRVSPEKFRENGLSILDTVSRGAILPGAGFMSMLREGKLHQLLIGTLNNFGPVEQIWGKYVRGLVVEGLSTNKAKVLTEVRDYCRQVRYEYESLEGADVEGTLQVLCDLFGNKTARLSPSSLCIQFLALEF